MQTNRQNLYAAGDVSQGYNLSSEKQEWLGTWGNACRQGRIAGCNMAGKEASYPGSIPQNISPFFDWTYAQLGDMQPQENRCPICRLGDPRKEAIACSLSMEDILIGANLINCTHSCGEVQTSYSQEMALGEIPRTARQILYCEYT